jgi:hypothetical protein
MLWYVVIYAQCSAMLYYMLNALPCCIISSVLCYGVLYALFCSASAHACFNYKTIWQKPIPHTLSLNLYCNHCNMDVMSLVTTAKQMCHIPGTQYWRCTKYCIVFIYNLMFHHLKMSRKFKIIFVVKLKFQFKHFYVCISLIICTLNKYYYSD